MELRHLRYFTAVVQCQGYREASKRLRIAQPAISQTVIDLEQELGVSLFSRAGRAARLTPHGEVFYPQAVRTLLQAESAIAAAKQSARCETRILSVGFWGPMTHAFLPELIRAYRSLHPEVKLLLREIIPDEQVPALDKGTIDLAFTSHSTIETPGRYGSIELFVDPILAVVPVSQSHSCECIDLSLMQNRRFVLFHRAGAPRIFDVVNELCNESGFLPDVVCEVSSMQTVISLIEAEEGVSLVPASVRNLGTPGVCFHRLASDAAHIDISAVWRKNSASETLQSLIDLIAAHIPHIREITEYR